MGVLRLLPALAFVVLLAGQVLVVSDLAYADSPCACGMPCPGYRCYCNYCCFHPCATSDSFESSNFQLRSVHSSPLFANNRVGNDNGSGFTLVANPQAFLKLQCQRLKEMLSWVSDLQIRGPEFQATLQ